MSNSSNNVYKSMDKNNDSKVSKSEFHEFFKHSDVYESWDTNNDGKISEDEFADGLYGYYDDNGDGYINDAEWKDGIMVDDYGHTGFWDL